MKGKTKLATEKKMAVVCERSPELCVSDRSVKDVRVMSSCECCRVVKLINYLKREFYNKIIEISSGI